MNEHSNNIVLILILIPLLMIFVGLYALDVACPLIFATCGIYLMTVMTIIAIVKLLSKKITLTVADTRQVPSYCLITGPDDPRRKSCCNMMGIKPSREESKVQAMSWPILLNVENDVTTPLMKWGNSSNTFPDLQVSEVSLSKQARVLSPNEKAKTRPKKPGRRENAMKTARARGTSTLSPGGKTREDIFDTQAKIYRVQPSVFRLTTSYERIFQVKWESCQELSLHPPREHFGIVVSAASTSSHKAQVSQPKVVQDECSTVHKTSDVLSLQSSASNTRMASVQANVKVTRSRSRTYLRKFRPFFVQRPRNKLRKAQKNGSLLLDSQYVKEICRNYEATVEDREDLVDLIK